MIRRCHNPVDPHYVNYGARGIRVFDAWHNPATFIAYVDAELGPEPAKHTIDRIDNDGDYRPGNIRWADRSTQNANQRQRTSPGYPVGTTGYKGVRLHTKTGLFQARLHLGGRERSIGYFKLAHDAALAYDAEARRVHGSRARLNFPAEVSI